MSVFNVPVVIGVDEERLAKEIAADAKRQVLKTIEQKVINSMFDQPYNAKEYNTDLGFRNMIKEEIKKFMADKEDIIIDKAAELLADKLFRSKKVRDKMMEIVDEALEQEV